MAIIEPTAPQWDYIHSRLPFPAMVAGFGAGKTHAAVYRAILGLRQERGTIRGFYEPTYDLIRMIAWPRFEEVLTEMGLPYKLRQSPVNMLEIEGYGTIVFRSMDNPDRIVGYEHSDADIDELDTLKYANAEKAFRQILARNRLKKKSGLPNTIGVTTTPEGFKFVYETWKKNPAQGYGIIKAPTYSNPHLPDGYVESLKNLYPSNLLQAYLEGEFVNLTSGSVYYAYNREDCHAEIEVKPREELHIGLDFNVYHMAGIIHVVRDDIAYAVDEILNVRDTPDMIEAIKERYEGHKIIVYPDAAGQAASSTGGTLSDHLLLKQAGFKLVVDRANPKIKDRVRAVNAALEKGQYFVNQNKCRQLASCFEQQIYTTAGLPDKSNDIDHPLDAAGYFIVKHFPLMQRKMFTQRLMNY